jgi:GTPase SAR1 family protein
MDIENTYLFKIVVLGDPNVGKTALINKYVHNKFSNNYKATVGVDFSLKILELENGIIIKAQLWDISGQERFMDITKMYYRWSVGCVLVCDIGDRKTLLNIKKWKQDLDKKVSFPKVIPKKIPKYSDNNPINTDKDVNIDKDTDNLPTVLLVNKSDLYQNTDMGDILTTNEIDNFAEENQINKWYYTSAKTGQNIYVALEFLYRSIISKIGGGILQLDNDSDIIHLYSEKKQKETCCYIS